MKNKIYFHIIIKIFSITSYLPENFITIVLKRLFQKTPYDVSEDKFIKHKITRKDLLMIKKKELLFDTKRTEYKKGESDYFPLYNEIQIKEAVNKNDEYKFKDGICGFTKNYHGKGLFALSVSAIEGGNLLYAKGSRLYSADGGEIIIDYKYSKSVTPEEFVDLLKEEEKIDITKEGNTGNTPIYLISCLALQGGDDSAAQCLANYTGRVVYAYSKGDILAPSLEMMNNYEHRKKEVVRLSPLYLDALSIDDRLALIGNNAMKRIKSTGKRNLDKLSKTIVHPKQKINSSEKSRSRKSL